MLDMNRKRRLPDIICSCDDLTAPDGHLYTQDEMDVNSINNPDGSLQNIDWKALKNNPLFENVWQSIRTTGIGGSEVGILLGINHWQNALDLYYNKTCTVPTSPASLKTDPNKQFIFDFGHAMEEFVGKEFVKLFEERFKETFEIRFSEEYGELISFESCKVIRDTNMYRCPEHPFLIADFDFLVQFKTTRGKILEGIFECKTSSPYQIAEKWNNGFPASYEAQVRNYMLVGDYDFFVIACASDNNANNYYAHLGFRDKQYDEKIINVAEAFWACVKTRKKPVLPDVCTTGSLLAFDFPDNDDFIDLTNNRYAKIQLSNYLKNKKQASDCTHQADDYKTMAEISKSNLLNVLNGASTAQLKSLEGLEYVLSCEKKEKVSFPAKSRNLYIKEHPELKETFEKYIQKEEAVSCNIKEDKLKNRAIEEKKKIV